MKDITATTIGALTGSGIGYTISKISEHSAHAAAKVRPKLAELENPENPKILLHSTLMG